MGRPGSIPELHRLALQESRVTIFISCYMGTRWATCCSTSLKTHCPLPHMLFVGA